MLTGCKTGVFGATSIDLVAGTIEFEEATMPGLEETIKDFAKKAGAALVGVAGPERMDGPASLDPGFIMRGARSIVSIAIPLDVNAIYEFFGKISPAPHNIDQAIKNQRAHRICTEIADYLIGLGYKAKAVPPNNTYRRSVDPFMVRPTFSHRFGALVAGLGSFGLSGNLVTKEYGACIILDTVVTSARLKSDPLQPARFVMDNRCKTCKLCDKSCTMGMFRDDDEEYLLINGELHARGKRDNVDFCNAPCFGLHAISRDNKWTNWGQHWIKEWMDAQPDPHNRREIREAYMRVGGRSGDSTLRFDTIRHIGRELYPRDKVEDSLPDYEHLPRDEQERAKIMVGLYERIGFKGLERDPNLITCSQCMMVCGQDFEETRKRYDLLLSSGYVVPDPDWKMIHVDTYEEALALKEKYKRHVHPAEMIKDTQASGKLWFKDYFGYEPVGEFKDLVYRIKARSACARAGLKGKEATAPLLINPSYLAAMMLPPRKKKKKRPVANS
jgi:ferredoxin